MSSDLRWKIPFILIIIVLCVVSFYPPGEKVRLGLDLRGGMHIVLNVVTDDAVQAQTDLDIERMKKLLGEKDIPFDTISSPTVDSIVLSGADPEIEGSYEDLFSEYFRDHETLSSAGPPPVWKLTLQPRVTEIYREQAIRQALETIRNRVDEFGVADPIIQRQGLGGDRILLQLPGLDDPERVKRLIKRTAFLEWKLVKADPAPSREIILQQLGGQLDADVEILESMKKEGQPTMYYAIEKTAAVTGRDLKNARRSQDRFSQPNVLFSLTAEGGRRFKDFSGAHVGERLAIVLDNKVVSAPNIKEQIPRGEGTIEGQFSVEEADDLALVLRAGALPASIRYIEERTIGPSLGWDSIQKGLLAGLLSFFAVVIFMIIYYKLSGINAFVALVFNMIIILGVLSAFKATLTLPGIAGFILTVGMSVDANVLIFERIREELRVGKTSRSALDAGFKKAFRTILDANVTTLIAAIFLFQFGTGPVKGFAVILSIGIASSMFTALFVSRVLFSLQLSGRQVKQLSI
jgi:preprotein translocase subunit SecD